MTPSAKPTLIRPYPRKAPPGSEPGRFHIDPSAPKPRVEFFGCYADHCDSRIIENIDELEGLVSGCPLAWVNIDGLGDEKTIARLGQIFGIHPLALEDVVHVHQRAKVEEYPDFLFIVMRMVWKDEEFESEQIALVLKPGLVVTFQERPGDCLDPVRKRLKDNRSALVHAGADRVAYAIIDAVVDGYFPVTEAFGETIEELEDLIPHAHGPAIIGRIHDLRQGLLFLRRCVWPLRETVNIIVRDQHSLFTSETVLHLRDVYDHTVQLMDVVETHRELCADLRDFYYAVVSQRTNEVMKFLTIVATIFMPLSFIVGVYGMNFDPNVSPWNMPELKWAYGYPFAWGIMLAVLLGMLWYFKRRGWLQSDDPADDEETA
jgi:magnesium transporter